MKINRKFERQGPLWVPRYDWVDPGERIARYRKRWNDKLAAAITFDAASNGTALGGTTISWNHVVGGSANPCLYVSLFVQVGGLADTSTCTFNSVSMTKLGTKQDSGNGSAVVAFVLANPTTGTHSISATIPTFATLQGQATSWFGVGQGNTQGTTWRAPVLVNDGSAGAGAASPASVVVSNAVSGDLVLDSIAAFGVAGLTVGGSQTQQFNQHNIAGSGYDGGSSSEAATGSTTMQWTYTGSHIWAEIGVALIPAVSGDTATISRQWQLN